VKPSSDILKMLDNLQDKSFIDEPNTIILIDGFNLFYRVFSVINVVNPVNGAHIGGLGGFLRSLGSLIKILDATEVYVIFDGGNSSTNRKNLIPEYKAGRNQKLNNWKVFDDKTEEETSKIDQITRVIQYLKILPVKTICLDNTEADDVIAYMSQIIKTEKDDRVIIVSNDSDFLQLINNNVIVYNPGLKEYFTPYTLKQKYDIPPHNFLIYKTLMGDVSDALTGIKGLGVKKIFKYFPQLKDEKVSFDDIYDICAGKFKEHLIYARFITGEENLKKKYKIMDLSNPMIDDKGKEFIEELVDSKEVNYIPEQFLIMCNGDNLEGIIRNPQFWVRDIFDNLVIKK